MRSIAFGPIAQRFSELIFFSVPVAGAELPLIVAWLIIGALFFTFYFRFINLRAFGHALRLVRGDFADPNDPGEVSHFQALATAVSGTVGVGNIAQCGVVKSRSPLVFVVECKKTSILLGEVAMIRSSASCPHRLSSMGLTSCHLAASLVLGLLGFSLFVACEPEPAVPAEEVVTDEEADIRGIQELVGQVVQAYNTGDVELFCGLYAEDAVRMPPGAPVLEGRQRICDNIATSFATYDREVTMRQEEARFSGDLAVARGTWAVSRTLKTTGEEVEDVGKWFFVMERQEDDGWKIAHTIWNSDLPLASS